MLTSTELKYTAKDGYTYASALHAAAMLGDLKLLKELQKDKEKFISLLNIIDTNKDLALDRSVARGHLEITKELINAHKINQNKDYQLHNKQHYTPLLSAVRWYFKVLDGTYNAGGCFGKFNTQNPKVSYPEIIKLLIDNYPQHIDIGDNKGCTPLYYMMYALSNAIKDKSEARKQSAIDIINVLMQNGASLNARNKNNYSVRMLAENLKILDVISTLEEKIKNSNSHPPEKIATPRKTFHTSSAKNDLWSLSFGTFAKTQEHKNDSLEKPKKVLAK